MTKRIVVFMVLVLSVCVQAEDKKPTTLKGILLEQLQTTHNKQEWFATANTAVAGLTAQQASWRDGKGNHSVGQLVNHLIFWDRYELAKFNGQTPEKYSGNNDQTFTAFDSTKWNSMVKDLDQVMTDWEKAVEAADDAKIQQWASAIAHVGTHNAYHIGQIVFVRKEQGSWDASKGVK